MRRMSYAVARGVFAVSIVVILAGSAFAASNDEWVRSLPSEKDRPFTKIVRVIKKSVRGLGDLITIPRP